LELTLEFNTILSAIQPDILKNGPRKKEKIRQAMVIFQWQKKGVKKRFLQKKVDDTVDGRNPAPPGMHKTP